MLTGLWIFVMPVDDGNYTVRAYMQVLFTTVMSSSRSSIHSLVYSCRTNQRHRLNYILVDNQLQTVVAVECPELLCPDCPKTLLSVSFLLLMQACVVCLGVANLLNLSFYLQIFIKFNLQDSAILLLKSTGSCLGSPHQHRVNLELFGNYLHFSESQEGFGHAE